MPSTAVSQALPAPRTAPLDTRLRIETPEGIDLILRPAGLVPRALAFAIDLAVRGLILGVMFVPLFTLGQFGMGLGAILMRLTRAAMIESLSSDYVTFARSRGLSEWRVTALALRNSSIPIITAAGLVFTYVIGGTILVETAFALPGLGLMLQDAVLFKDVALVQALVLLVAIVIALITVAIDLTYAVIDPRVRRTMMRSRVAR